MDQLLVIEGSGIYDGSHLWDTSYFTMGDYKTIKRISGLRRTEIPEAITAQDDTLWVAFATICLQRLMDEQGRGEIVDEDVFWNARQLVIRLEDVPVQEEDEQLPPPTGNPSSAGAGSNGNSGNASTVSSAIPATVQQGTGTGSWDPSGSAPSISPD